jgi:hypothetical protein
MTDSFAYPKVFVNRRSGAAQGVRLAAATLNVNNLEDCAEHEGVSPRPCLGESAQDRRGITCGAKSGLALRAE